jgi:hypothetical protein
LSGGNKKKVSFRIAAGGKKGEGGKGGHENERVPSMGTTSERVIEKRERKRKRKRSKSIYQQAGD